MPRPLLEVKPSAASATQLTFSIEHAIAAPISPIKLQQRLRQKRSQNYLEVIKQIDASSHEHNATALNNLLDIIAAEFPDLTRAQGPSGIVSRCYLGSPYITHICDFSGDVIEHFESNRLMPPLFERARLLALHPAYSFVEVYQDALRGISHDGSVSVVENQKGDRQTK
jgi:hypothetical protein